MGKSRFVLVSAVVPYRCLAAARTTALCCSSRVLSSSESSVNLGWGEGLGFDWPQTIAGNPMISRAVMTAVRTTMVKIRTKFTPEPEIVGVKSRYHSLRFQLGQ